MVSNWFSSISRSRWGNSMVTTPPSASRVASPATKSFKAGTWASTLLPTSRSAETPRPASSSALRFEKNAHSVGMPACRAASAMLAAGSMPSTGTRSGSRPLPEVAEQVAVVAGDLHHPVLRPQPEALDHRLGVAPGVLDPARRDRREVGVVAEDLLRPGGLGELHQQAALADEDVERVEGLRCLEIPRLDVGVGQRREPQVDEGALERGAAEAAGWTGGVGQGQIFQGGDSRFHRPLRWR